MLHLARLPIWICNPNEVKSNPKTISLISDKKGLEFIVTPVGHLVVLSIRYGRIRILVAEGGS